MAVDLVTITALGSIAVAVTTAEAKTHMRVDHSTDDTYIDTLIDVATTQVQAETGFKLLDQAVELRADSFRDDGLLDPRNADIMRLRVGPVSAVTSVKYDDGDDSEQTFSSSSYWEDILSVPGRVRVKTQWPETRDKIAAVRVRLQVGYATASVVPEHFKLAVKLLVGHWYENREEVSELSLAPIPRGVSSILEARPEYHFYVMGV